jgi:hypothetical protein
MLKKTAYLIAIAAALGLSAGHALANVVDLQWTTTVLSVEGAHPAIVGETLITTIEVNNGGSSVASQTWSASDFVSYREEGPGWFFESTDIDASSSGVFSTDAAGVVLTAGTWFDDIFPPDPVNTSWAGATLGGWWNNGYNATSCVADPSACVNANNVRANLDGASWTASLAEAQVPEPTSLLLFGTGLGLIGLAAWRRRK